MIAVDVQPLSDKNGRLKALPSKNSESDAVIKKFGNLEVFHFFLVLLSFCYCSNHFIVSMLILFPHQCFLSMLLWHLHDCSMFLAVCT